MMLWAHIILIAQNLILYNARGTFENWLRKFCFTWAWSHCQTSFQTESDYLQLCKLTIMTKCGTLPFGNGARCYFIWIWRTYRRLHIKHKGLGPWRTNKKSSAHFSGYSLCSCCLVNVFLSYFFWPPALFVLIFGCFIYLTLRSNLLSPTGLWLWLEIHFYCWCTTCYLAQGHAKRQTNNATTLVSDVARLVTFLFFHSVEWFSNLVKAQIYS